MLGPQTPLLLQSRVNCSVPHRGWASAKHFSPPPTATPHPSPWPRLCPHVPSLLHPPNAHPPSPALPVLHRWMFTRALVWQCMALQTHRQAGTGATAALHLPWGGFPASLETVVQPATGALRAQGRQEPHAWPSQQLWVACESPFGHVQAGNLHREGSLWPYLCPRVLPVPHPTPRQEAEMHLPCKSLQKLPAG